MLSGCIVVTWSYWPLLVTSQWSWMSWPPTHQWSPVEWYNEWEIARKSGRVVLQEFSSQPPLVSVRKSEFPLAEMVTWHDMYNNYLQWKKTNEYFAVLEFPTKYIVHWVYIGYSTLSCRSYFHNKVHVYGLWDCERLEADVRGRVEEINRKYVVYVSHKVRRICSVCPTPLSDQSNHRYWNTFLIFIGWRVHWEDFLYLQMK